MLTASYLSHCQLDFQIFRLLEKSDPDALASLLRVSEQIVSIVLRVGNLRTRASFLAHDFKFLVSCSAMLKHESILSELDSLIWPAKRRYSRRCA